VGGVEGALGVDAAGAILGARAFSDGHHCAAVTGLAVLR
jgi:hypothetical protein